jgi:hypothetical protein
VLFSCNTKKDTKNILKTNVSEKELNMDLIFENQKKDVEFLVKNLYKSIETVRYATVDSYPVSDEKDSIYICLDFVQVDANIRALKKTDFFANEFIENWEKLTVFIDKKLKSAEEEWLIGDMSPFWGSDVDRWCLCQDIPNDNFWEDMQFDFLEMDNQQATLTWTWGNSEWSENFNYKIRVIKENGTWKIAYMQGFDINNFIEVPI